MTLRKIRPEQLILLVIAAGFAAYGGCAVPGPKGVVNKKITPANMGEVAKKRTGVSMNGWHYCGSNEKFHFLALTPYAYVYLPPMKLSRHHRYKLPVEDLKVIDPMPRTGNPDAWKPLSTVVSESDFQALEINDPRFSRAPLPLPATLVTP